MVREVPKGKSGLQQAFKNGSNFAVDVGNEHYRWEGHVNKDM